MTLIAFIVFAAGILTGIGISSCIVGYLMKKGALRVVPLEMGEKPQWFDGAGHQPKSTSGHPQGRGKPPHGKPGGRSVD